MSSDDEIKAIDCRVCGAFITLDAISLEERTARCDVCRLTNPFRPHEVKTIARGERSTAAARDPMLQVRWLEPPKGASYREQSKSVGRTLILTRRWFTSSAAGFIIIGGFIGFGSMIALANGVGFALVAAAFALSAGVSALGARNAINWTRLELDDEQLRVIHGPLPWIGQRNATVPCSRVRRFFVADSNSIAVDGENQSTLSMELDDESKMVLLRGYTDQDAAEYAKSLLEARLTTSPKEPATTA